MSETEPASDETSALSVKNNNSVVDQQEFIIELQKYYSGRNENSKKSEWTSEKIIRVIKLIEDYNLAKIQKRRPTNKQYYNANKYEVHNVGNEKVLIMKRKSHSDPVVQIIPSEEYYQRILDTHIATGHGRRDKIVHALRDKYMIPIFAITILLKLCKTCLSKKSFPKSGIVVKPFVSDDCNRTGQVDLVNFQISSVNDYKWLLHQDRLAKFGLLGPLNSQNAKEEPIEAKVSQQNSGTGAAGVDNIYIPSLYYFDAVKFLGKSNEPCHSTRDSFDEEDPLNSSSDAETERKRQRTSVPANFALQKKKRTTKENVSQTIQDQTINDAEKMHFIKEELETIGKSIGLQLRDLDKNQLTITQKIISDAIYYAKIGKLTTNSFIDLGPSPSTSSQYRYQGLSCPYRRSKPYSQKPSPQSRSPSSPKYSYETQSSGSSPSPQH